MKLCLLLHFVLSTAYLRFCHADEQLMVCKPVNSVFETRQTNSTNQGCSSSTGRPGKQGAQGLRGTPGPAGPPGVVDYERVNSSLFSELEKIKKKLRCFDGVVVGSTCYKLIYRVGVGVNHEKARRLCTFHGGALAEIPTEEVYNAVFDYVKTNWYIDLNHQESSFVRVWLGSSYDGNGNVILTSGRRGYVKWYPNRPLADARQTHMAIHVPIEPEGRRTSGMFNIRPEFNAISEPLCQFHLEEIKIK